MQYKYQNDNTIYKEKDKLILKFLYKTILGRAILKIITLNFFSKFIAKILNSRISIPLIKKYIKKYSIDIELYENKKYKSFNDFFKRKLKNNSFSSLNSEFISCANSKISYYKISDNLLLNIKNSMYNIAELINNNEIVKEYKDGICLIFRLEPSNYHRYIFCDNGTVKCAKSIKGKLHTVNPIVYDKYNVFIENYRNVTELYTENFGKIMQIEVGALCVGKITNYPNITNYKKYDEKGYFEFGGSTIIQLIKKDIVKINNQIIENTNNNIETKVEIGEIIGKKVRK